MNVKKIFAYLFFLSISCTVFAQGRDLLGKKYTPDELCTLLIPQAAWTPFPKINDREGWAKADQTMLKNYISEAEKYLDYDWPSIPATASLAFVRTGDRQIYETISSAKRAALGYLLIAEIAENKGRFVDQIINGAWSLCEESWWGYSAHVPVGKQWSGLVDVNDPIVDLFASETGLILAWVDYYMGEHLDAMSPQLRKRIYYEVDQRLFKPFMNKYHWWMGESADGRGPNNWNPWIISTWINYVLLLEKNDRQRARMIYRALSILDEFINWYPQDGGCDEGPSYWGGAAHRMFHCFQLLNMASNDAFRYVYDDEKIKNMARFIYRAQINEEYFLNFADADPRAGVIPAMAYLIGKDIGDRDMMEFAAYYRRPTASIRTTGFYTNFFSLFLQDEVMQSPQRLPLPKDVWLNDLQVMTARDRNGSTDGFYLAAKGGHNAEAHNHNDVGSFVVYYDGKPLLIDVGRGTYTQRTFDNRRYEIWFNRSDYHNLPTVNGIDQFASIEYKASNVSYKPGQNPSFTVDIARAYPAEAAINQWKRTVELQRGKSVQISDVIDLGKAQSIVQHMMTCYPAEIRKPGELLIRYHPEGGRQMNFVITYNPAQMEASVEKIKLDMPEDVGVLAKWGDVIHRINFKVINPKNRDTFTFRVKPE